jgi:AraC family transcriptional regulator
MNFEPTRIISPTGALVRGSSLRLASSVGLGWNGIALEHHLIEPGEIPEAVTADYIIEIASGEQVSYGERPDRSGQFVPYSRPPGTICLYSEGLLPALYPVTETDLIVCALDPAFVSEIAEEVTGHFGAEAPGKTGFRDESVRSMISLLAEEAKSGGLSGRLYVDHLTYALTLRLLSPGTNIEDGHTSENKLSHPRLRRVVERMEADLDTDLDLQTLAKESGYSRNHFLRMFRAATGYSPHQYLLHLRMKKAQSMILLSPVDFRVTRSFRGRSDR